MNTWSDKFINSLTDGKVSVANNITESPEVTNIPWDPAAWKKRLGAARAKDPRNGARGLNILAAAYTERFMQATLQNDISRTVRAVGMEEGVPLVGMEEMTTAKCENVSIPDEKPRFGRTIVSVQAKDVLTALQDLRAEHPNAMIAMHNTSYNDAPDKGWLHGVMTKEGSLLLRTTLGASLDPSMFPLDRYDAVYCTGVTVFRGTAAEGYPFLAPSEQWAFDVVTTPSFRNYKRDAQGRQVCQEFTTKKALLMRGILEKVFASCLSQNVDVIVLSAFGCGHCMCPPAEVAEVCKAVITQFAGFFSHVIFAILGSNPSDTTADTFTRVLCNGEASAEYADVASWALKDRDFSKKVCPAGGCCEHIGDRGHLAEWEHPAHCPYGPECSDHGAMHRAMFTHDSHVWWVLRKGESISMREKAWALHATPAALFGLSRPYVNLSRDQSIPELEDSLRAREDMENKIIYTQVAPAEMDTALAINSTDRKVLTYWTEAARFKLLYRASRDGFGAEVFHKRCDYRGSTLVIVQTADNCVFGGYTSVPWARPPSASEDYATRGEDDEFVFSLRGPGGANPVRFDLAPGYKVSVTHRYGWGPIFGKSAIMIADSANVQSSCDPAGNFVIQDSFAFVPGDGKAFWIKDYEVHWVLSDNESQDDIDAFDEEFPEGANGGDISSGVDGVPSLSSPHMVNRQPPPPPEFDPSIHDLSIISDDPPELGSLQFPGGFTQQQQQQQQGQQSQQDQQQPKTGFAAFGNFGGAFGTFGSFGTFDAAASILNKKHQPNQQQQQQPPQSGFGGFGGFGAFGNFGKQQQQQQQQQPQAPVPIVTSSPPPPKAPSPPIPPKASSPPIPPKASSPPIPPPRTQPKVPIKKQVLPPVSPAQLTQPQHRPLPTARGQSPPPPPPKSQASPLPPPPRKPLPSAKKSVPCAGGRALPVRGVPGGAGAGAPSSPPQRGLPSRGGNVGGSRPMKRSPSPPPPPPSLQQQKKPLPKPVETSENNAPSLPPLGTERKRSPSPPLRPRGDSVSFKKLPMCPKGPGSSKSDALPEDTVEPQAGPQLSHVNG